MEVKLDLYIASRFKNDFMKSCDMCPDYKVFVDKILSTVIDTTTEVNDEYIYNLIDKSKTHKAEYWIPAIMYNNSLYITEGLKIMSDGKHECFIPQVS